MNRELHGDVLLKTLDQYGLLTASDNSLARWRQGHRNGIQASSGIVIYMKSLFRSKDLLFCMSKESGSKYLWVMSKQRISGSFPGRPHQSGAWHLRQVSLDWEGYQAVREHLPWTAPVSLREAQTTFGCGDRLGLASPGHIRAAVPHGIFPVLAQQSVRELNFTGRTFEDVVSDAAFLVLQEGYTGGYGADGDHIKHMKDIRRAVNAHMPMITLDLTEQLLPEAGGWSDDEVDRRFGQLPSACRQIVKTVYEDRSFNIDRQSMKMTKAAARRCAVIYWKALDYTEEVHEYLRSQRGDAFDLEVSIDETTTPTKILHHLFIASELQRRGMKINSLAPRFIGEFQKGIDYIGNIREFEDDFIMHSRIARTFGNYKISIHSGSDKFSVYPAIGKHTEMKVHVKTAGTSWLEALHAVLYLDQQLFLDIVKQATACLSDVLGQYHITADFSKIPDPSDIHGEDFKNFLVQKESRQMLHISFGSVLGDPNLKQRLVLLLNEHEEFHYDFVESHIARHISRLTAQL